MITPHPSLTQTVAVMRKYMTTEEEWDVLATIEHAVEVHQPADPEGPVFGDCVCCRSSWPCRMWDEMFALAVEWTSRKAGEACVRAQAVLAETYVPPAPKQRTAPAGDRKERA